MLFAGFDPSITAAGIALVRRVPNGYELVDARVVRTSASDTIVERCTAIWRALSAVLREGYPQRLTIEEQHGPQVGAYERGEFNADNSKTIVTVGLAMGCALAYGVPVVIMSPQQAKIAVLGKGGGHAEKSVVQAAVMRVTRAPKRIAQDAADAVALAIAGAQHSRTPWRRTA